MIRAKRGGTMTPARDTTTRAPGIRAASAPTAKARLRQATIVTTVGLAFRLGCAHQPSAPIVRPYPPPTVEALMEALARRQSAISSMDARVRATSWLGGDRVRATVLMLVDRPGRLRFEAEISLQGTVAILATDGARFAFLDVSHNQLRRGPACPANVASLIRIPLAPADVAAILLGDARATVGHGADTNGRASSDDNQNGDHGSGKGDGRVEWDEHAGADVLVLPRDDGWLRFSFQIPGGDVAASRLIGAIAVGLDGRTRWRVAFDDLARVSTAPGAPASASTQVWLPGTIKFAEGTSSFDDGVEVKFKDRKLGPTLAPESFMLATPAGTTIIDVGCPPLDRPAAP